MIRWSQLIILLVTSQLAMPMPAAQELTWVTAEGSAPMVQEKDRDRARQIALADAERNAVVQALATGVTVETLLVNLRLAGSILGAIPYGKVVEKKILDEGAIKGTEIHSNREKTVYRIRIHAAVQQENGGDHPYFHLDAQLNQSIFKEGDELKINIRSTKPCYFAIFNILEGNTIFQLLPNNLSDKRRLEADEHFTFPDANNNRNSFTIRTHLPQNKTAVTESIYIMALLEPFDLPSKIIEDNAFGVFSGRKTFMQDLVREVVTIPMASRAEKLLQYEIRQ